MTLQGKTFLAPRGSSGRGLGAILIAIPPQGQMSYILYKSRENTRPAARRTGAVQGCLAGQRSS